MAATIQTIETPKRWRAQDTSGNNNHGQIYSGRGLEFDGVTDYLTIPSTSPYYDYDSGNGNGISNQAWTMATWMYIDDIDNDTYQCIMGWISDSHVNYGTGIMLKNDGTIFANAASAVTTFYDDRYTTSLQEKTWYRVIATSSGDGAGQTVKLYLNGVNVQSTTGTTGDYAYKFAIGAGRQSDSTTNGHFEGKLSDAQVWNTAWTADDVAFDYANPEQLALNRGGTSLTESNLKLWYPMNDGHRGQQSYVLDASNTGLGDVSITNGDFSDDTSTDSSSSALAGWTNGGTHNSLNKFTISDGKCNIISDGTSTSITQEIFTTGVTYKYSIEVTDFTSGAIKLSHGSTYFITGINSVGTHTGYFTASDPTFSIVRNGACNVTIDNVSFQTVNDKNHATTVFYGDMTALFPDVADASNFGKLYNTANTEFDFTKESTVFTGGDGTTATGNSAWTGVNCTNAIEVDDDDGLEIINTASSNGTIRSGAITTVIGTTYQIDITHSATSESWVTSDLRIFAGTSAGASDLLDGDNSDGSYSATFVATSIETHFTIGCESTTSGHKVRVQTFQVREVGTATGWTDADQQLDIPQTALQSYNQLAWFPGVDPGVDYDVDLGSGTELDDIWDGGGSVSAWIYPVDAGVNNAGRILDKAKWLFYVSSAGTKLGYTFTHGTTSASGTTDNAVLTAGEWAHVVMSYNDDNTGAGNEPKIYVNGEEVTVDETDSSGAFTSDASDNLFVGNSAAGTRTFHGCITEISMWNTILSQSSVNELYNDGKALNCLEHSTYIANNSSLKGYWRNNGLATWQDLTANDNDGTVNNLTETILQQAGVDASRDCQGFLMNRQKDTNMLNLVGRDSAYVSIPVGSGGDLQLGTSAFSIGFWLKRPQLTYETIEVISLYKDSTESWAIYFQTDHDVSFIAETSNTIRIQCQIDLDLSGSDNATADNDWHYYVFTCERETADPSSKLIWYIDGEAFDGTYEQRTNTASENIDVDNFRAQIGRRSTASTTEFQIDDVQIYKDKLEAAEVKRNYNAGKRSHR